jgi:hypothetical protein
MLHCGSRFTCLQLPFDNRCLSRHSFQPQTSLPPTTPHFSPPSLLIAPSRSRCWLREKFFFAAPHLLALSHTLMPRLPALLGALPLSFVLFSHLVTASNPANDVSSSFAGDTNSTTGDTSVPGPPTSITSNRHILESTDSMLMFETPLPPQH